MVKINDEENVMNGLCQQVSLSHLVATECKTDLKNVHINPLATDYLELTINEG